MPTGSYGFEVGDIRCTVLSDGYFSYPASWFFPNADPQELAKGLAERRGPSEDQIVSPYTCLLVETGRSVILVDTGAGSAFTTSGAVGARLEMLGIRARDVDTVVLTHAHPDHIGGALDERGRPAFVNARHVIAESECDYWGRVRPNLRDVRLPEEVKQAMRDTAHRCLLALRHQLEPIGRETEISPGVRAIPAPGHTPGHMVVLIGPAGDQLLNMADAVADPLHVEHPEWHNGFDHCAAEAVETRRALLNRAASEKMRVMAFHFPFPSLGRVSAASGGGWAWTPGR